MTQTTPCDDGTPCKKLCPTLDLRSMLIGIGLVIGAQVFGIFFVLIAKSIGT